MFGKKPSSGDALVPVPQPAEEAVPEPELVVPHGQEVVEAGSIPTAEDIKRTAMEAEKEAVSSYINTALEDDAFIQAKMQLIETLIQKVDIAAITALDESKKKQRIFEVCDTYIPSIAAALNGEQIQLLKEKAIDEVLGFGPLEILLSDPDVSDIMVNGPKQVYVEKSGRIYITDITFTNESHLLAIIQRIVTRVGRRVDEANPMVDARMPDGSRFNAIIPPLALDGSLVSIRKFKKNKMPLDAYIDYESMSEAMAEFLAICSSIRLNIMVSGGTGSGKTTLLNALSGHIGLSERVITIEDAAELQLHQPHVLRLETRPASIEGTGEVNQRQLVKNALRMRPDRIILGEIRGDEIIDVLSAMNTGHDGSMSTIHSNNPRDCIARIESLVNMSGVEIPEASLRYQVASAIHLIVQIQRMRDGKRRITHIEEVVGIEGTIISMQSLFKFKPTGMREDGTLGGEFQCAGIMPKFIDRAEYFGKTEAMRACLKQGSRRFE